jgi:hypothetical protein
MLTNGRGSRQLGDLRERLFECPLERVKRKRLHEVRIGLEGEHPGVGRVDAREEHRDAPLAESLRERETRLLTRLEHSSIDDLQVGIVAVVGKRLMTEAAHDELEQRRDVVVRFADEDACHESSIEESRRDWAAGMV